VGDILTIVISEKVNATKNSGANASRTGSQRRLHPGHSEAAQRPDLRLDGQDAKLSAPTR
jgi:flagellar L-ring protein precursor FlgH